MQPLEMTKMRPARKGKELTHPEKVSHRSPRTDRASQQASMVKAATRAGIRKTKDR
jgi:hypothetical protein